MQILGTKFDKHVGGTGTFAQVSEGYAKHLDYKHPLSTRAHPADQSGGMNPAGNVVCVDGIYGANPRLAAAKSRDAAAVHPINGAKIALAEWPTYGRIRSIKVRASKAAEVTTGANPDYFSGAAAAAFPAYTLHAVDPNDPTFTPIPLLNADGELSLQAIAFGCNYRKDPLVIQATLGGAVVADSLLAVFCEFVVPFY